ncbi:MAG: aminotransferase class I/II-fold pyridoxal phosphate-dependent enzyme [Bacteroidota bacterium]
MNHSEETLDPKNWDQTKELAHKMVDDAIDYLQTVRERPVWQQMPDEVIDSFNSPLPKDPSDLAKVYQKFMENGYPYPMGNVHPRFWMWYMGSSNFTGAMGDFMAAIIGSNLGGGNHSAARIDDQVVDWCRQMVGFPETASGTLVSGGSMANIISLTVARNVMADVDIRKKGVGAITKSLRFYSSDQVHGCHQKGLEILGLGNEALHKVKSNSNFEVDIDALKEAIKKDKEAGYKPACIIANAGTVNTGSIDDIKAIAEICKKEEIWFHVDGCIGALIAIAPKYKHLVSGIELADSIALDPHKWLHAPFEVGCTIIRNKQDHFNSFATSAEYLEGTKKGIPAAKWLHNYSMQISRGFRALKVWMSVQEHGIDKFGRLIDQNIEQALYLTESIQVNSNLELVAPTKINIVSFRFVSNTKSEKELKKINMEIMLQLQETGIAAISDTTVHEKHCLRVAICNYRTVRSDLDLLVEQVVKIGNTLINDQILK